MSDPYAFAPPPAAPAPRRGRAGWLVAAVAAVVAIAAVAALVVVLATGDDDTPALGSGSERGFDSPEEAVTFMVDRLADGEAGEAAEAFAVEPVVEGWDFEAQADRIRVVMFTTWLPSSSEGYDEINADVRRGEIAVELRSLVRSALAPEREYTASTPVDEDGTAEDLAEELSPEPLAELAVAQVDEIDRTDEQYLDTLEQQAAVYGADEFREVAMLLDTPDGQAMGGATVVRYGDQWAIMSMSAPLLGLPLGELAPATEQEYDDAVADAIGGE